MANNRTTESLREGAKKQWARLSPEQREAQLNRLAGAASTYYASDDWNNGGKKRRSDKQKASWTEERKQARKLPEWCKKQSEAKLKFWASEKGQALKEQYARQAQERFGGKPKSRETRARMSEARAKLFQAGFQMHGYTKRGHYTSTKTGLTMWYRSSYEQLAMTLLDKIPEVVKFDAETMRVRYEYDGWVRHYIPDLEINLKDGRTVYIEIKPSSRKLTDKDEAKITAAQRLFGDKFHVLTELSLFIPDMRAILNI